MYAARHKGSARLQRRPDPIQPPDKSGGLAA